MTCFGTSCKQFKKYATYDYYLKLVTDYSSFQLIPYVQKNISLIGEKYPEGKHGKLFMVIFL